jgi:transcriptional regulator with XRE-family HTH domain
MAKQPATKSGGGPGVKVNVAALRAAREKKGWSQRALAEAAGCPVRTVERIEQRGTAALKTLAELAQALGVTSDALRPQASDGGASRGVFQLPASLPDFEGAKTN